MEYQFLFRVKELSDALSLLITSEGCCVASPADMKMLFAEVERRADFGDGELQDALGQDYAHGLGLNRLLKIDIHLLRPMWKKQSNTIKLPLTMILIWFTCL